MNKRDLEALIWNTRQDFFKYLTEHTLTARSIEETHLVKQYNFKHISELGIKTETECELVKENLALKEEIEDLRGRIELLLTTLLEDKPKWEKLNNDRK